MHYSHAMKTRLKNSLKSLLGKLPRWENPEESIGKFIKMIDGNKNCWKATGRAREMFEVFAKDIKIYTDECVDFIPGLHCVTWSIYMIGKNPQTATLVVMFFCEERGPRRKIQDYVKQSEILRKYPGIKTNNAALPPDLENLESLASNEISHGENSNISLFGSKVVVKLSHNHSNSTRIATAGGTVHHNGAAYVFTAGHLFYETSSSDPRRESKVVDDQWEVDSDSHDESNGDTEIDLYNKEFVESTSRASNSCSYDGSSDAPSTESSPSSDPPTQVDDQVFALMQAAGREVIKAPSFEDTTIAINLKIIGSKPNVAFSSAATEGHVVVLSADLDYALIKFKDKNFKCNDENSNLLRPTRVFTTSSSDTQIITSTISGGLMTDTLNGTPSYTRLPHSRTFQKVYTVYINGALVKGDCGSWVIDAEDGGLYGHIVAGSESTGTAYIISAQKGFEDIKERLGGELLVARGFATKPISSIDLSKTAGSIVTREPAISRGLQNPKSSPVWPSNPDFVDEDASNQIRSSNAEGSPNSDFVDKYDLNQTISSTLNSISQDDLNKDLLVKNDEQPRFRLGLYPEVLNPVFWHAAAPLFWPFRTNRNILSQTSTSFRERDAQVPSRNWLTDHENCNEKLKREEKKKQR